MKKTTSGFTLIELMVTLLVASILMGLALPSFKNLIDKLSVRSTKETIVETLRTARVTAVEERTRVKVCGLADDGTCSNAAADWEKGMLVLRVNDDDSEDVLHQVRFNDSVYVQINGDIYLIYINQQGWTVGSADSILVCNDHGDNEYGYRVVVSRAGRVRSEPNEGTPWTNSSGSPLNC